ncbi:winged helix repair factor 1-like [Saccoglossus kowalevskii]|uniref:Serine/threonine-protein kinase 19-like n=1 Tax=Saccoglossus kowalevskii TaxID=10224 RepID=A0ABM0MJX2_SACKO|nr:PREDICTED: serine/threonine-protein kinase 19-like [Saccoglossus kowalevskii]
MKRSKRIVPDVFKKKRKVVVSAGLQSDWGCDQDSILSNLALPNDTKVALDYVKSLLHVEVFEFRIPTIIFKHQIYSIVHNKTTVDRQLEELKEKKVIKMFKLGIAVDEFCIVFTDDYKQHVKRQEPDNKTIDKFLDTVVDRCPDVSLTKSTMINEFCFTDEEITHLVSAGLLTVRDVGSWWLAIPGAGIFMKTFVKGRQSLLRTIRKCKYQEILQKNLEEKKLAAVKKLGMNFHILDIIGAELVKKIQTTSGCLLRLNE